MHFKRCSFVFCYILNSCRLFRFLDPSVRACIFWDSYQGSLFPHGCPVATVQFVRNCLSSLLFDNFVKNLPYIGAHSSGIYYFPYKCAHIYPPIYPVCSILQAGLAMWSHFPLYLRYSFTIHCSDYLLTWEYRYLWGILCSFPLHK